MKKEILVSSAILAFLTLSANKAIAETSKTSAVQVEQEACYGIAKAGKNDCATKHSSCSGFAKIDRQKDAYITVPKGLCDKIAGGSLTPVE